VNKPVVVQFEITGRDPTALHHFYASLFGWNLQETPGGHTSTYRRTSAAESGLPGAIGPTRSGPNASREDGWDGGSGQVTMYVEVADLPESLAAVQRLGGSVVAPLYEARGRELRVALIADPEGHVVGLSQGLQHAIDQAGYGASTSNNT
jgi:uncharacterized protein